MYLINSVDYIYMLFNCHILTDLLTSVIIILR